MNDDRLKPFVLLITGPVGAGKTTIANYLRNKLPGKTIFLDIDQMKFLFNCYKKKYFVNWLCKEKSIWYGKVTRQAIVSMIKTYTNEKVNVVVSGTWSLKYIEKIRKNIKKAEIFHLLLYVSFEKSIARVKKRSNKIFPRRQLEIYQKNSIPDKNTIVINANHKITSVEKDILKALKGRIIYTRRLKN